MNASVLLIDVKGTSIICILGLAKFIGNRRSKGCDEQDEEQQARDIVRPETN